jgi:HEAT repeat protein
MGQHETNNHLLAGDRQQPENNLESDILIGLGISKKDVKNPLQVLNSQQSTWQDRVLALQALLRATTPEIVQRIEECLTDKDERVRVAATRAIGQLRKSHKVPRAVLLRLLADENQQVKTTAIEALAALGPDEWADERRVQHLTDKLRNKQETTSIRVALIHLLGTLGEDAPVKELVEVLRDEDSNWEIRDAAAVMLGRLDTNKPVPALMQALYDRELHVRVTAAFALGKEEALKRIIADLQSATFTMKARAAQLLGELGTGTDTEIGSLISLATSATMQPSVRIEAILALGNLGEQLRQHTNEIALQGLRRRLDDLQKDSNQDVRDTAEAVFAALYPERLPDVWEENA